MAFDIQPPRRSSRPPDRPVVRPAPKPPVAKPAAAPRLARQPVPVPSVPAGRRTKSRPTKSWRWLPVAKLLLALIVLAALGGAGYYYWQNYWPLEPKTEVNTFAGVIETFSTGSEDQKEILEEEMTEPVPILLQMEQLFAQNLELVTPETFALPDFDPARWQAIDTYIDSF